MPHDFQAGARETAVPAAVLSSIIAESLQQKIKIALPIRDMIQSAGIPCGQDHPIILEVNRLIGDFNVGGPVQIAMVESPSGALPHLDMMAGRPLLRALRNTHKTLPPNVTIRLLVRGPFGVSTVPMHPRNLKRVLTEMTKAAGAADGRTVILKLFEAQNTIEEHVETLKIASALRKQGSNVKVELAMCYTASERLDVAYYQEIAKAMLNNGIDSDAVAGIGYKDMIGMMKGEDASHENENSAALTTALIDTILRQEKLSDIYLAYHTHQGGTAAAQIGAGKAFLNWSKDNVANSAVRHMMSDSLPGGLGFPDTKAVLEGMGIRLSPAQDMILRQIEAKLRELFSFYGLDPDHLNDHLWSGEQLRWARVPGGAVPTHERDYVNPVAEELLQLYGNKEPVADLAAAKKIIAGLFVHVNRQLSIDCGEAHSVTPGARNLGFLSHDVMLGMLKEGFVQQAIADGIDFNHLPYHDGYDKIGPLRVAIARIPDFYEHLSHRQAIDYVCGTMPFPVEPHLMKILSKKRLEATLPTNDHAGSALAGIVSAGQYENVRAALLTAPTDKENARAVIDAAMTRRSYNWLTGYEGQNSMMALGHQRRKADEVVKRYVGKNEFRFDHGTAPTADMVDKLIEGIADRHSLISHEDAMVVALIHPRGIIKRADGNFALSPDVIQYCRHPAGAFPTYWPKNDPAEPLADGSMKTTEENQLIEALIGEKARSLADLHGRNPSLAAQLYNDLAKGRPMRFPYMVEDYAPMAGMLLRLSDRRRRLEAA